MKVIRIEDLPKKIPPNHYNMFVRSIANPSMGAKSINTGLARFEPKGRADPHVHENSEQLFIVLKGKMMMKTEREEVQLIEGQAALIFPGEVHENYNLSDGVTEYLTITVNVQ
jgi:quercetin dioxygenase-like cupin family protein